MAATGHMKISFVSGPDAEGALQARLGPISVTGQLQSPRFQLCGWDAGHLTVPPAGSGQHTFL